MNVKERIKKEIEIQKNIEGEKCQDKILLEFLNAVTMQSQWDSFVNVKFHPYGKLSYECHRFYYPTKELLKLMKQ
ncbi:hypothetical protein [Alkaliphilus sp. B6464]|uniref:hypothetical protein n=1 Tax=Alkaliphilus sp. B6464 TaxID=2731219 RepID=UPI001BA7D8F1|nr:hypothetical protein [Alkaliphilus sp. B6464]QUH21756.1 hypothetical protein HYG84_17625 [Alkaliphilus sp. B6464]